MLEVLLVDEGRDGAQYLSAAPGQVQGRFSVLEEGVRLWCQILHLTGDQGGDPIGVAFVHPPGEPHEGAQVFPGGDLLNCNR